MKKFLAVLLLTIATTFAFAQCSAPTVTGHYKKGKNYCFELPCGVVYKAEWQEAGSTTWASQQPMTSCLTFRQGNSTYQTVQICASEGQTIPSNVFYGIQNGWKVRFLKKCPDNSWSEPTQSYTVRLR